MQLSLATRQNDSWQTRGNEWSKGIVKRKKLHSYGQFIVINVQIFWEDQNKIGKIFCLIVLTLLSNVKNKWNIFSNSVAFSQYLNFTCWNIIMFCSAFTCIYLFITKDIRPKNKASTCSTLFSFCLFFPFFSDHFLYG